MKKILFTGGGSAGHVVPNIPLIEALKNEADVCYMGTDGIEKRIVASLEIPYFELVCPKLVRGFAFRNFKIPFELKRAVKEAERGLDVFHPDLVFSKGGYVALPAVLAAKKRKITCLTHESDLSAGLANRLMAKRCKLVLTSFPETAEKFPNGKYCGSPVRPELYCGIKSDALKKYGLDRRRKTLLVFGGGSGSRTINEAVRKYAAALCKRYNVLHLCGQGNEVESNLKNYRQIGYEYDMGSAYAAADLVISRAGSNTVFEILALKKPAIFIPLERGSRGDQAENADYFRKKGLCRVIKENELDFLPDAIEEVFADQALPQRLSLLAPKDGNANVLYEIRTALRKS